MKTIQYTKQEWEKGEAASKDWRRLWNGDGQNCFVLVGVRRPASVACALVETLPLKTKKCQSTLSQQKH